MGVDPITIGLVISTAASVASALLGPKQPDTESTGPRLGDTGVTTSAEGQAIPRNFGTARAGTNVIWAEDLVEVKTVVESEIGKGGGPTNTATNFSYFLNAAMAIQEGVASQYLRIWADNKLIYDGRPDSELFWKYPGAKIRFYTGTETQLVDPLIEAVEGVGNTPAFRGTVYFVVEDLPVQDFGNRVPQMSVEITQTSNAVFPFTTYFVPSPNTSPAVTPNPSWFDLHAIRYDKLSNAIWATNQKAGIGADGDYFARVSLTTKNVTARRTTEEGDTPNFVLVGLEGLVVDEDFIYMCGTTDDTLFTDPRMYVFDKNTLTFIRRLDTYSSLTRHWESAITFDVPEQLLKGILVASDTRMYAFNRQAVSGNAAIIGPDEPPAIGVGTMQLHGLVGPDAGTQDEAGAFWVVQTIDETASDGQIGLTKIEMNTIAGSFRMTSFDLTEDVFGAGNAGTGPVYGAYLDQATQRIIVAVGGSAFRQERYFTFDIATESFVDQVTRGDVGKAIGEWVDQGNHSLLRSQRQGSSTEFVFTSGDLRVFKLRLDPLGLDTTYDLTDWIGGGLDFDGRTANIYIQNNNSLLARDDRAFTSSTPEVHQIFLDRSDAGTIDLATIVTDLSALVGIQPADLDVTDLVGTDVRGFEITRRGAVRNAIERLALGFFFDPVETDFVIRYVARGGASAFTVDEDDLGTMAERLSDNPVRLKETRQQEIEIPMQVDVTYTNIERDYQAGDAYAKRMRSPDPTVFGDEQQKLDLPIVFNPQEGAEVADKALAVAWTERDRQETTLPYAFLEMDPTDILTIVRPDCPDLVSRASEMTLGNGLVMELRAVNDDAAIYTSEVTGTGGIGFIDVELDFIGPPRLFVFDIPLLRDTHDVSRTGTGPYLAASPNVEDFRGAIVQESLDQVSWSQLTVFDTAVAYGATLNSAAAKSDPFNGFDRDTSINVSVAFGDSFFSSTTEAQVLLGANAALWGSPSAGWEIIKFATVTSNVDGTITLTDLIRGRRGTSRTTLTGHSAGEQLVLLNQGGSEAAIDRKILNLGNIGSTRFYRTIAIGGLFDDATFNELLVTGIDLEPYEAVHIDAVRANNGDGPNGIDLTWVRQTRVGGTNNWLDGVTTIPVSEDSLSFEVALLDKGLSTESAVQTVSTVSADWTEAQLATAGYTVATDPVNFVIYQMSVQVGRGFPAAFTAPAP